ncbi:ATP-binding protein [Desulfosarcina sp. BuS5]|uniref:ATP-binding protein n=1 Tax=Desulfosarcina sp. BuS5 TaxID=933262 RepID=UPI002377FD42|nr:ATP-binding protein [Desulfosarcina sp. BuS5]
MKFLVSHISVAFEFDGSLPRRERFAYPLPALREALLNAVVHRDYANSSDIQIKIFDDRITIFSPGKLLNRIPLFYSILFFSHPLTGRLCVRNIKYEHTVSWSYQACGYTDIQRSVSRFKKFEY